MGIGVEICIVFIEFFYVQVSPPLLSLPTEEGGRSASEAETTLGGFSFSVSCLGSVVWVVWQRGGTIHLRGLYCQGSKQPTGREQREQWLNTHCLQRLCFKLLVTRKIMGQIVCWCSSSQLQQSYSRRDVSCSESVPSFPCSNSMRMAKKCIRFLQACFEFSFMCLVYLKSLEYAGIIVVGSCRFVFFSSCIYRKKKQCMLSWPKREKKVFEKNVFLNIHH